MSEKVTFQELIESIAEETDNSKQFTHDFLKDFVNVINDGLEREGSVNIAGFGKFNLRRVDEREGYNPQTEENMTIPAHNKVVFKPYKDLRELVNAPYAHLEPELLEEEDSSDKSAEEGSTDPKSGDQSDFIPTAPPTQESKEDTEEAFEEEESPFDFGDQEDETTSDVNLEDDTSEEPEEEKDSDIVEFNAEYDDRENDEGDLSDEEDDDFDIDEFITSPESSSDQSGEEEFPAPEDEPEEVLGDDTERQQTQDSTLEEESEASEEQADSDKFKPGPQEPEASDEDEVTLEDTSDKAEELVNESDDILNTIGEEQKDEEDKEKEEEPTPTPTPSFAKRRRSKTQNSAMTVIIAASFVLLLVAGGAWYFGLFSDSSTQQMASEETTAANVTTTQSDQPAQPDDTQSGQQAAQKNQDQSQEPSSAATAQSQTSTPESENMEIQEGQTLWSIAEEKYGNPRLWPWIYGNNGSLNNPDLILAGSSVSVPLPSGPQNSLTSTDSTGVAKGYLSTYRWYKNNNSSKAKNHLWAAKLYHDDIRNIADVPIDEADLSYANRAR